MENNRKICCDCKFYSNAKLYCNEHGTKQQSNYSCNYFQPKAAIDWEQRKYEIAKEVLPSIYKVEFANSDYKDMGKIAINLANALVEQLKEGKQ